MGSHSVLVVEDDAEIRDALIDILEENGFQAVGSVNGLHALNYLKQANPLPCLILLDLMMPIMDGQAFREEQLKDPHLATIPIIVISAYRDLQSSAEKLKPASILKKPPKIEELVSIVAQYC